MSKLLYVAIFDEQNHYDCLGLLSQFKNNILCIFTSDELYYTYQQHILSYKAKGQVIRDPQTTLWNIVKHYSNHYDLFGLIHYTKILYYENNTEIKLDNKAIYIHYKNLTLISVYNEKLLIQLNQLNSNIYSMLNENVSIDIEKMSNKYYQTHILETTQNTENSQTTLSKFTNIYEDDFCVFLIVKELKEISGSAIFINKRNMKAYHINDLLSGNVLHLTENNLVIDWIKDNHVIYCSY